MAVAEDCQPYYLHVRLSRNSESFRLLEPYGPVQACNGITFILYSFTTDFNIILLSTFQFRNKFLPFMISDQTFVLISHLTMFILTRCASYPIFIRYVIYSLIILSAIHTLLTTLFHSLTIFPFTASALRLCILPQHSRTRNLISDYSQQRKPPFRNITGRT